MRVGALCHRRQGRKGVARSSLNTSPASRSLGHNPHATRVAIARTPVGAPVGGGLAMRPPQFIARPRVVRRVRPVGARPMGELGGDGASELPFPRFPWQVCLRAHAPVGAGGFRSVPSPHVLRTSSHDVAWAGDESSRQPPAVRSKRGHEDLTCMSGEEQPAVAVPCPPPAPVGRSVGIGSIFLASSQNDHFTTSDSTQCVHVHGVECSRVQ